MKYRVNLVLDFVNEANAMALMDTAKKLISQASNTNEGKENQEIGFIDYRESNHDDPTRTIPDKVILHVDVGKPLIIAEPIIATG